MKVTRRERFSYSPLSASSMRKIGEAVKDHVAARIRKGLNARDEPAKSLTEAYARRKLKRGLQAVRDLFWTGKTMESLKVLSASANRVKIGFGDPKANIAVGAANKRERVFAESPGDRRVRNQAVADALKESPLVKVVES